jgi:uncharacterized 2Fe-2S/4Fe-4S cluster protein (DUF4445 family)
MDTAQSCHIGVRYKGQPDDSVRQVAFTPGVTLRDILNSSSLRVRSACAGIGACGLCRVRIDTGQVGSPTQAEFVHLGEDAIADGVRLACQIAPETSLDVTVLSPARPSPWRSPIFGPYRPNYPIPVEAVQTDMRLGVAVDLGTTNVTVGICDLASGRRIAVRTGLNPQAGLCSDVIGRLHVAAGSSWQRRQMQTLAEQAIRDALRDLLRGEGLPSPAVTRVRVVGNTAMLTLLSGADPRPMLEPKQWCQLLPGGRFLHPDLARLLELDPGTDIALIPALGGFVGSDLILGVVHTRMLEQAPPTALIDFGTNSEIGLWDGEHLWVTAAAGGPAFEGVGIGCGMAAEAGAIHRLFRSGDGVWQAESLEDSAVAGICGSGLIDLLAHLIAGNEVDERGRPRTHPLEVNLMGRRFSVAKADIDMLQRAKAAIAAGLETLTRCAGISLQEIRGVHVAGAFGLHLDLLNAISIGLLPEIPIERFHLAGNTALSGAFDIMLSSMAEKALRVARDKTQLINLSMEPDFDDLFVDRLFLRPFSRQQDG